MFSEALLSFQYILLGFGAIMFVELGIALILFMFIGIDALCEYITSFGFLNRKKREGKKNRKILNE